MSLHAPKVPNIIGDSGIEAAFQRFLDRMASAVSNAVPDIDQLFPPLRATDEALEQCALAVHAVSQELPKRGWYLTGQEPITIVRRLAQHLEEDWS